MWYVWIRPGSGDDETECGYLKSSVPLLGTYYEGALHIAAFQYETHAERYCHFLNNDVDTDAWLAAGKANTPIFSGVLTEK